MVDHALEVLSPNEAPDLDNLAKQIDAAHVEVGAALLTSVQRAAEVGHLLAQAKEQVPFGQWETWVEGNTAISPRTARNYKRIARHWIEADKAKRQALAVLGLQGFLAEIAEPRRFIAVEPGDKTAAPRVVVRSTVEEMGRSGIIKIVATETTEDPGRAGDSDQSQIAATMKSVREAEERSAAPRESRFNKSERLEFRRSENLDAAKRAYLRLDRADQQEFQNWITEGAAAPATIIDIAPNTTRP